MEPLPEFGIKRENEERRDGGCGVIFDPETKKFAVGEESEGGLFITFGGGVNSDEDMMTGVLREVKEESGLYDFLDVYKIAEAVCHYYSKARKVNRIANATSFLIILKSKAMMEIKHEEHEKFTLVWKTADEILTNWKERNEEKDLDHWFYFFGNALKKLEELGYGRD